MCVCCREWELCLLPLLRCRSVGAAADYVNGKYVPGGCAFNGRLVYKKENADVWIEYHAAEEKWMIKRGAARGDFRGWVLGCVCVCVSACLSAYLSVLRTRSLWSSIS